MHVKGAAEQLTDLVSAVQGVGPGRSLANTIQRAQAALATNDVPEACSILQAFTNEVKAQSGKSIPAGAATALIADATRIRAVLNC